jgi:hypothetical protein
MTEPPPARHSGERASSAETDLNTVRIGIITICGIVGAGGYWSLSGKATDDVRPARESRAQAEHLAASVQEVRRKAVPAPDTRTPIKVAEPAFEPDATELLQPSQTFNEVLDAVNADIGPDGEYVDPAALAAVLRSDPELGRLVDP